MNHSSTRPPSTLIFVALEPPLHKIFIGRDKMLYCHFSMSSDQIAQVSPTIHAKLVMEGRETMKFMAVHASSAGVIPGECHDAIARQKPDAIICCHTIEARRLNSQYPIIGYYEGEVICHYDTKSLVVKFEPA